jgi:hypothetical protein
MATIKICDNCGVKNEPPDNQVRGYRWMRLMDKNDYKHRMLIKIDLCDFCHDSLFEGIKRLLIK